MIEEQLKRNIKLVKKGDQSAYEEIVAFYQNKSSPFAIE
ncbi:hypothetical protein J416_02464 [Gracilibacillus halophilus YIM-C55.5]|uniref:Uncharacterized protein n=1 Tax=Gracilibacillus halophilus YIM-C55.5 TaxID=1308866 RepID=N4WUS9_9BACI|nr:hypothetical protein J416_02464 [Gracilibacillus halophilus YIM-C55.5]